MKQILISKTIGNTVGQNCKYFFKKNIYASSNKFLQVFFNNNVKYCSNRLQ